MINKKVIGLRKSIRILTVVAQVVVLSLMVTAKYPPKNKKRLLSEWLSGKTEETDHKAEVLACEFKGMHTGIALQYLDFQ